MLFGYLLREKQEKMQSQNIEKFVQLVEEMRKCQRAYFAARKGNYPEAAIFLEKSKAAEKAVDDFCKEFRNQEAKAKAPELF